MIYDENIANEIAEYLLDIKAVVLRPRQPFTWASGWLSPIYCDNRMILSYPKVRKEVIRVFCKIIRHYYNDAECIAGVATAGIAHAALIAEELNLPMAYVRTSPKGHGLEKLIEGKIDAGQKVLVIEDLISTGKSSIQAANTILEAGANVIGLGAVFSYEFEDARQAFTNSDISFFTLSGYTALINLAIDKQYIAEIDLEMLTQWRKSPQTWKPE